MAAFGFAWAHARGVAPVVNHGKTIVDNGCAIRWMVNGDSLCGY